VVNSHQNNNNVCIIDANIERIVWTWMLQEGKPEITATCTICVHTIGTQGMAWSFLWTTVLIQKTLSGTFNLEVWDSSVNTEGPFWDL